MDPAKIGYYFSKLFIEDDEKDLVRFTFTGHEKKIKCHKSILADKSSVFKTMFGANWSNEGSVKMDDQVDFDQYEIFKIFIELVYEIRNVDTLNLTQATSIHFYSHKYQMNDVTEKILIELKRMIESGIIGEPFTAAKLEESLDFAQLYQLDQFNKKLSQVKLALDVDDPLVFFELAKKYRIQELQDQVIEYLKTEEPNDKWTLDVSHLVLKALQKENSDYKTNVNAVITAQCLCRGSRGTDLVLHCGACKEYQSIDSVFPHVIIKPIKKLKIKKSVISSPSRPFSPSSPFGPMF